MNFSAATILPGGNAFRGQISYTMLDVGFVDLVSLPAYNAYFLDGFEDILQDAIATAGGGLMPNDMLQVQIVQVRRGVELPAAAPTDLVDVKDITADIVVDHLERQLQSYQTLNLNELEIIFTWVRTPEIGAYFNQHVDMQEFITKKKCIIQIMDNYCFYQCLLLCIQPEQFKWYIKDKNRRLLPAAEEFCIRNKYKAKITLMDVPEFAEIYNIHIVVIGLPSTDILLNCNPRSSIVKLILLFSQLDNNYHFHYVKPDKLGALYEKTNFCWSCNVPFTGKVHSCVRTCKGCKRTAAYCPGALHYLRNYQVKCSLCKVLCWDNNCILIHQAIEQCKKVCICDDCGLFINRHNSHKCWHRQCYNCKKWIDLRNPLQHLCHIQKLVVSPPSRSLRVYYDYETYATGRHEPALIIAMYHNSDEVFSFSSNEKFVDWVLHKKHIGATFIAHNGGKYDVHFVKKELLKRKKETQDICCGSNIFSLFIKDHKIRFLDSFKFIPVSLRNFPKTFGFTDLFKGYFPYTFLTPDTLFYKGPIPDITYFGFDHLKDKDYKEAIGWYDTHKNDNIDLNKMLVEYCIDDVKVLKRGCECFNDLILQVSDNTVYPWECTTIASVCLQIFRSLDLVEHSIAVLPDTSCIIEAQNWGNYMIRLKYGCTNLDGWLFDVYNLVWNCTDGNHPSLFFFSCQKTGCPKCFRSSTQNPMTLKNMSEQRLEHERYMQGFDNYESIRQCEWMMLKKKHKLEDVSWSYLRIRDALYGGRTEPFSLYRKAVSGERIKYVDFTSLYPSVYSGRYIDPISHEIKKSLFPKGHGVHLGPVEFTDEHFGFIKCMITSPADIHIPVLPVRHNGKLMFSILTKYIGTWTTEEVRHALGCGYVIDEVYDVYHFPCTTSDLFFTYLKRFMKLKIESGTWSKCDLQTDNDKMMFIKFNKDVWDIEIDVHKMNGEENPGMYSISKLCLNNIWGKLAQRADLPQSIDVFSQDKFFMYCANREKYKIKNIFIHDEYSATINYTDTSLKQFKQKYTNVAVAAYVTAHARLRLFSLLSYVGKQALYCDTDSLIYVEDNSTKLNTGPYLGDLTNELDVDDYIVEFTSTGPKSYAYVTNKGKKLVKCKGFQLNHNNASFVHFDSMKDLVFEDETVYTKAMQFKVSKGHNIETISLRKKYSFTFDKRELDEFHDGFSITTKPKILVGDY